MKLPVAHDGYGKVAKGLLVWALLGIGIGGSLLILLAGVIVMQLDF